MFNLFFSCGFGLKTNPLIQYWSPLFVASILLLFRKTGIFFSFFSGEAAREPPQKYSCQQLWSPTCFCTHIERTKKFTQIVVCTTNLTTLNTYTIIVWSKESKTKKRAIFFGQSEKILRFVKKQGLIFIPNIYLPTKNVLVKK